MESSNECKALSCIEKRINNNFCSKHTKKLIPIYKRYKSLQISIQGHLFGQKITDPLSVYQKTSTIVRLRQKYSHSLKSQYYDLGHEHMIQILKNLIQKTADILIENSKIIPQEFTGSEQNDSDSDELESEEPEVESGSESDHSILHKGIGEACSMAISYFVNKKNNDCKNTAISILRNYINSMKIQTNTADGKNYLLNKLNQILFLAMELYIAIINKKSEYLINSKQHQDFYYCCVKHLLYILIQSKEFVFHIIQMALCLWVNPRKHNSYFYAKIVYSNEIVITLYDQLTSKFEVISTPLSIPINLFHHECTIELIRCEACCYEEKEKLAYNTSKQIHVFTLKNFLVEGFPKKIYFEWIKSGNKNIQIPSTCITKYIDIS